MIIRKWQPFGDLVNVYDHFTRLFEDEFLPESRKSALSMPGWTPLTDIFETKDNYQVKMELPGFTKADIKIEFSDNTLSVKGERKQEEEIKKENFHRIERAYGLFERSFLLPKSIDSKKIDANLKEGLLVITIPKVEEAKIKAIPISVN